ncbi:hypothetical protein PAXRUDRAFT_800637 [Paxillus rubicundulus Ve08.2h10]|uniref:BTB domain-containing protein n=1 Tax=Paxillus rubicundulus Ve08.2h10 TaxID=930991 RepID=A0A0D0DJH7_9AGAM|nr:hypothetical protein PAXRUDRAFT_800637 [Paxillus rubicundulus Ve08.2h10]
MESPPDDPPASKANEAVPQPRTEPTTHPAFDSPDADVVLVSKDLVQFHVHSFTLKTTSGWFRSLFTLPRPSPPETIHLDEDSSTLELLLRMVSGLPIQPLTSHDTVDAIIYAAEKYDMPGPISLVRIAVLTPPLADQPLRLYAAAARCGWTEEAKVASQRTLSMNLWEDDNWEMLAKVDVRTALALLKLHRARREGLRKRLDEFPFIGGNAIALCTRCRRPIDHHTWRELKYKVTMEMDARPLGDTVLDDGLTEWPEAKACWDAKCPYTECEVVLYHKAETMRLIRECIESLPKTTS